MYLINSLHSRRLLIKFKSHCFLKKYLVMVCIAVILQSIHGKFNYILVTRVNPQVTNDMSILIIILICQY